MRVTHTHTCLNYAHVYTSTVYLYPTLSHTHPLTTHAHIHPPHMDIHPSHTHHPPHTHPPATHTTSTYHTHTSTHHTHTGSLFLRSSIQRIHSFLSRFTFETPLQDRTRLFLEELLNPRGGKTTLEAQKIEEYVRECIQNMDTPKETGEDEGEGVSGLLWQYSVLFK